MILRVPRSRMVRTAQQPSAAVQRRPAGNFSRPERSDRSIEPRSRGRRRYLCLPHGRTVSSLISTLLLTALEYPGVKTTTRAAGLPSG